MAPKYNPRKLVRMCSRLVNEIIPDYQSIEQLEIPKTLKKYIGKYYFTDNMWCDEKAPPIEMDDYPYNHEEPFIQCSPDEFLSLMRFDGDPWFGFNDNHVHKTWYELNNNNEPICYYCIHKLDKEKCRGQHVFKYSSCFTSPRSHLLPALQGLDMWCSICNTTSLFYIEPYHFHSVHHPEAWTREILFVHRIE